MKEEKIIISLTSWVKRVNNIPIVLSSILKQTKIPDKIVINLCYHEFKECYGESLLPKNVLDFLKLHEDIIEINWLENNTYVWKKSIPTMYKYPNDCIICIDDDFLYPDDFVETFVKKHNEIPDYPLSGVDIVCFKKASIQHCGCASMDKLEWLKPELERINIDIFACGDEDTFLTFCYTVLNKKMVFVGKKYWINMPSLIDDNGYSKNNNISNIHTWLTCLGIMSSPYKNKNLLNQIYEHMGNVNINGNDIINYICKPHTL